MCISCFDSYFAMNLVIQHNTCFIMQLFNYFQLRRYILKTAILDALHTAGFDCIRCWNAHTRSGMRSYFIQEELQPWPIGSLTYGIVEFMRMLLYLIVSFSNCPLLICSGGGEGILVIFSLRFKSSINLWRLVSLYFYLQVV